MMDSYKSASYKDILQIDGAFASAHFNYHKTPVFNGADATSIVERLSEDKIKDEIYNAAIQSESNCFRGTLKGYDKSERIELWKNYFMEYANAFDKLIPVLPKSVVTLFIARQTVEIGLKYLLLCKTTNDCQKTHDLQKLVKTLFESYNIQQNQQYDYMKWVDIFLTNYSANIEDGHPEYFRYPEYGGYYFAGICYDLEWLSYNFYLVILKLLHMAKLDLEI